MKISDFFSKLSQANLNFKIHTKAGIGLDQLQEIEEKLDVQLPGELKEFYCLTNGLEGDDFIFNIIPLNEVEKQKDDEGEYLVFAEFLLYSDTCCLEIDKTDKEKYKIFTWADDATKKNSVRRKYKTDSITDFIRQYCDKGTFPLFYGD